ncbi:MAG: CheW domain-containing protein [Rhodoferax sp.]
MVVDGVFDAITLEPEQMRPAPKLSPTVSSDHLPGIGSVGDRMVILLDIKKLMTSNKMGLMSQTLQYANHH